MAIIRGISVDGQLIPNANGTLYSNVASGNSATRGVITSATSYATSAETVELFIVPSGGSPGNANQISSKTFAIDEEYTWPELIGQSVETGGTLTGNDSGGGGTGVNIILTVTEFTGDS